MNDPRRTILHNPGAAGPLIVPFELRDITGAAMREDSQHVAIKMLGADGNRLVFGMAPAALDALLQTCLAIRGQLDAKGVERTIDFKSVSTAQCGVHEVEGIAFVSLIVDRRLPSAVAYLMPPKNARAVGKQLVAMARRAASARGEILADEPATAGGEE
jgi:hypothetical protein